jgi:hypothetical protein
MRSDRIQDTPRPPGRRWSCPGGRWRASITSARRAPRRRATAAALALAIAVAPAGAGAQFTLRGQKVPPVETNFAGVRQVSPRYGLIVQINHDALAAGDFELGLLDDTYAALLRQFRRDPVVPADLLPVVFVSEAKIARFGEGPRRRMFRWLEPELARQRDVHLSPAGIFISDQMLADQAKLRAALARGLGSLFDHRFRKALDSIERPTPDR